LLVADVTVEPKATDATSQVLKLKEATPDAIFSILYPGESAIFLRDANKYGLKGPFISTTGTMDLLDLSERSGNAAAAKEFYTVSFMRSPIGDPDVQKYTDVYKKYFPNDKLQTLSFYGMSGAFTIIDALRRAGPDLTREKFIAAMEATKDGNAGPAACKVNFSKDRHQGCLEGTIWGLRDGKIVNIGMTYPKN
jgi:branched-chain amino acid transport system substrate-binding protein